jgi:hypothetical protein
MALGTRMQQRRGTEAEWTTSEYVLAAGELGVTTDTGIIKIGDGVNSWSELDIAFGSEYLPILGTATNSALLDGISADSFVKVIDTSTAATADKVVLRLSDGRAKAATGTATDDVTNKAQMDAAIAASSSAGIITARQMLVSRTVTSATAVAAGDVSSILLVNHASLTAQVVVTVPANATTAIAIGSWVDICAIGNGGVKISPAGGVTVSGHTNAFPNYGLVRLVKTGTDTWIGISKNAGKRLPKIRAYRTGATGYAAGSYVFVPYDTTDANDTYNPDNEWFSIPGSGLPTARRIIVNKDGEYLLCANFISSNASASTYTRINKMINDNTLTGGSVYTTQSMVALGAVAVRVRMAAGESAGVSHATTGAFGDLADGNGGNRNDFTITRLSD